MQHYTGKKSASRAILFTGTQRVHGVIRAVLFPRQSELVYPDRGIAAAAQAAVANRKIGCFDAAPKLSDNSADISFLWFAHETGFHQDARTWQ
jgi:hypothetical protein